MDQCVMFHEGTMDVGLMQRKSIFQDTIDPESSEEILMGLASQIGLRKNTFLLFIESKLLNTSYRFIHRFYPQNGICIQKHNFWSKNDGEKWSRFFINSFHVEHPYKFSKKINFQERGLK